MKLKAKKNKTLLTAWYSSIENCEISKHNDEMNYCYLNKTISN